MESDYTLVVGVDAQHLRELALVWPTWVKHKPELLRRPMVIFYDRILNSGAVQAAVPGHPAVQFCPWPGHAHAGDIWPGTPGDRWQDPQRAKMLAGFVYVPMHTVHTPYWLKLDTDAVAMPDGKPLHTLLKEAQPDAAIIAHGWSFTKPADQMQKLDAWVAENAKLLPSLAERPPLNLIPQPGATRIGHKRIISWCGFFQTRFSCIAAHYAAATDGWGYLPVPSQDGYHFYVAARLGLPVVRTNMKSRGWEHWGRFAALQDAVHRSLHGELKCTCGASSDIGACGHHPDCPMKPIEG